MGFNSHGQFGLPDLQASWAYTTPMKIMDGVSDIAAGSSHSLVIKQDNTLYAMGRNNLGQLGDGTLIDKALPVKIMDEVADIAAAQNFSLVLKKDKSLLATGSNADGQLGIGSTTDKNVFTGINLP